MLFEVDYQHQQNMEARKGLRDQALLLYPLKDAVFYEPGTETGAVVPEISAPRLHAIFVPEQVDNNRLIEAHREWLLEGDVTILGIPKKKDKDKNK